MALPKPLELEFLEEILAFEKEKHMPYVTSAEQFGLEAGIAQGRQEGRQEGLQEGLKMGLMEGIESGLNLKFGPDAIRILPEIRRIADVEVLRKIQKAIGTATTLDALRQAWS